MGLVCKYISFTVVSTSGCYTVVGRN